jgi:hypothetical protein
VYAQEEKISGENEEVEEKSSIRLLSILINNEPVELIDEEKILVKPDDAVRLSGIAEPKSELFVYFGEKELKTTVRDDGYWFILFSITNMEEAQYAVRVGQGELEDTEKIITLVLGESNSLVDPLEEKNDIIKVVTESKTSYIVPIILVPLSFVFGWILGTFTNKKGNTEKSKKKNKK